MKYIQCLAGRLEFCSWNHVFREANSVADAFAKHGGQMNQDFRLFEVAPSFVYFPFLFDASSVIYQRGMRM